jgi:C4-dicarboxylate-specific signal transduction histidine kinase/CheY-like chemotaxis protein
LISLAILSPPILTEALQVFLQSTLRLTRADAAAVWSTSQNGEKQPHQELVVSTGVDHERVSQGDKERAARVTLERKVVKIDELRQDQSCLTTEWVTENGFISYVGIPIIVKEKVTGVLELFYRSPFTGTSGESDILDYIAKQTFLVIYIVKLLRKIHRHGQLSSIQLQQVQPERASGAEEFMAKAAHQLNNVLTAISGYAQLLKINIQDEQLKENADIIFNGVRKASAITGALLAFARRQESNKKEVSLNEILQKAIELKSDDLNSNRIRIVKDLDLSLPPTFEDPHQLQQVFVNLITDATKAMEEMDGKRVLSIATQRVGNNVRIRFSNNASKVAQENPSNIYKSISIEEGNDNGVGQEFLNSYEIVKNLGGKISMEKEFGRGTSYFVDLPALTDEVSTGIDDKPSGRCSRLNGKKGLLIDDDIQVMNLLSEFFKTEGCDTEVVSDGNSALEKLQEFSYHFILCDIKMPAINGMTLYQRLKEKGSRYLESIIFTTGGPISCDIQQFLKSIKCERFDLS